MIQHFVDAFMAKKEDVRAALRTSPPDSYDDLFTRLVALIYEAGKGSDDDMTWGYDEFPRVDRITVIDHGDYQGTRLFVVGCDGYQPSTYWYCKVSYGSCSGCDAFEASIGYSYDDDDKRVMRESAVDGLWTLMLHMVQSMKRMSDD